ncbi:MAG TPA: fumarylacetoacetase [Bryobacteraceae bacterium]|nr:fumarylacetoacetase [Bryobacteraceae bacterium]
MADAGSWVESANDSSTGFPIQNLPYALFRTPDLKTPSLGVGIGELILDLRLCVGAGLLSSLPQETQEACRSDQMNALMALGQQHWSGLRARLTELLGAELDDWRTNRRLVGPLLTPISSAQLLVPAAIGDYTDFYASLDHALNVGRLFRPEQPLFANYKYVPIAYHGRSSSIVVSGTPIPRPSGQRMPPSATAPVFGPTEVLDYELEIGLFVGPGNRQGKPIPIAQAEQHIFGLCLVNDWSARDIQRWEYMPLGPFLSKSFATSISPWVVPMQALEPFRAPFSRPIEDPEPLPYLRLADTSCAALNVTLVAEFTSEAMRAQGSCPIVLTKSNLRHLYWTLPQLIAHHTSNGCNLLPGDLLATGTVSGPTPESRGCLLESTHGGRDALQLPTGEQRTYLDLGDEVVIRGWCEREGFPRISFGECRGRVL